MDCIDTEQLIASGVAATVEHFDTIGSTQDRAHALAREARASALPILVVAEEQTAGRGRGSNSWWTARGSLAFSLLLDPDHWGLSRQPMPQRSLIAGVAVVDTASTVLISHNIGLHWPNDVFVDHKKLAGILIDVLPDGRHIIGIGLNVNNSFEDAPAEVQARAISLCQLIGRSLPRTQLLIDLLRNLEARFRASAESIEKLGERFDELCLQQGKQLTVDLGSQSVTGRCAGIAGDGALCLETSTGLRKLYSGVLRHTAAERRG